MMVGLIANGKLAPIVAAVAAVTFGIATMDAARAGEFTKQELADIKTRNEIAEVVRTSGLSGRTNTSYTTTNLERVQTRGLSGRTNTSYQPYLGIGHSNGLSGRTNF